jgi:hypothetical protein
MSPQQAASVSVVRAEEILDLTIAQAGEAGRDDLIRRLSDARRLLMDSPAKFLAGDESQQGATSILFVIDQLTEMLRSRQSRLVQHGRAAQARAAARLAEERTESLRGRSTRWQKMLHDSFATITSDVDFDLRQRMQVVLAEAEHAIEQRDPAKSWDEFAAWLHHRLAYDARANNDLAVTSSRTVSLQAAKHFTLSEMHIIDPPPVDIPTDLATALTADQALGISRAGISAVMNIFLRAYMGFVMFYLLTRLTGLALPAVIGLVPALFMGGLALVEERKRRLEKRQAQASATVRSYVTDFSMRVTKDCRDLLRQLEQELRDAYGARTEEMQRSVTEARNLAHRTLKELEQSPTLLTQIDTDLAFLADLRHRAATLIPDQLMAPSNVRHLTTSARRVS